MEWGFTVGALAAPCFFQKQAFSFSDKNRGFGRAKNAKNKARTHLDFPLHRYKAARFFSIAWRLLTTLATAFCQWHSIAADFGSLQVQHFLLSGWRSMNSCTTSKASIAARNSSARWHTVFASRPFGCLSGWNAETSIDCERLGTPNSIQAFGAPSLSQSIEVSAFHWHL